MNIWMIGNETSLSELEDFYSHLNMEDITDADYTHSQCNYKDLKVGNLGKYHDKYVQKDTLLLADVFENFQNMCLGIYELDPAHFPCVP